jgi:hypothetical protein
MCIKGEPVKPEDWTKHLPKDLNEFYVYKILKRQNGKLISPARSYEWTPGEHKELRANGETGFYAFLESPNIVLDIPNIKTETICRFKVKTEDIINMGPDEWNSHRCMSLVLKKITLTEEDYKRALDEKQDKVEIKLKIEEVVNKIKPLVKKAKEKVKETIKKVVAKGKIDKKKDKEVINKAKKAKKTKKIGKKTKKKN